MTEEHNKWYWKLYRWFRWEFKYQYKYIKYGVKNLYKWFWIIWKDRDWDHYYIFQLLKFKLEKVGNESIGVMANNKKVFKMRFKFESEKLASSLKMSGESW